jgi:hypothetical protein
MINGTFVPGSGFDGAHSQVTQRLDGYEILFDQTDAFPPAHLVQVIVDGYDWANNHTHLDYVFRAIDDLGPEVFDFHPIPNSVDAVGEPIHISFGIRDRGDSQVLFDYIIVDVSDGINEEYVRIYDPWEEFQNGWSGSVTNQPELEDGYIFNAYRPDFGDSFAVFTVRVTSSDEHGNISTVIVGQDPEKLDSGSGIVTGYDTLRVGSAYIFDNDIHAGDMFLLHGVGALTVDGYAGDEVSFDRQIAAGGEIEFDAYRGSFMLERRVFEPLTATATSDQSIEVVFSDPLVDPPISVFTISGGSYPLNVISTDLLDSRTVELITDVPMEHLLEYVLTCTNDNWFGFDVDDGYEDIRFAGFPDIIRPKVLSATNEPYNINVTIVFDEYMLVDDNLLNPGNYWFSHGAYATDVQVDEENADRVVLTVERLYGRTSFEIIVSENISDRFYNYVDPNYNQVFVSVAGYDSAATLSGVTGKLRTRNNVRRLHEDSTYWYVGTSGGLDIVSKIELENKGFVLDGYGFNAVTSDGTYVYFGSADGYDDAYGVYQLAMTDADEDSTRRVVNKYNTDSAPSLLSNEVNDMCYGTNAGDRLLIISTDRGVTKIINDSIAVNYRDGYDIGFICLDEGSDKLYIANNTLGRLEVFYDVHLDLFDRQEPDAYYSTDKEPALTDSTINGIAIAQNYSIMDSTSNTLYIATDDGLTRIDTDESIPGMSEDAYGLSLSYGIVGSGAIFELISGTSNRVVSVDVNMQQLQLFIATENGMTIINLPSNSRFAYMSEQNQQLISDNINDITFKNL